MAAFFVCQVLVAVPDEDLACPGDRIADADTCRLGTYPQLQVLRPVVVLDTVQMMHVLSRQEIPAEHLLHDQDVLEDVASVAGPRVVRRPEQDVPALVPCPAASPVAVRITTLGAAGGAGGVL